MAKYQDILKQYKTADGKGPKEAMDWLRQMAFDVHKQNPHTIINTAANFKRMEKLSINSIGKMYLFNYDPKLKDKLPYYDMFPLVFPIEFYNDGFLGINLHYLPPVFRARLMDALYETINNDKYDKTTKLRISYQILNGASRFRYFKPCIKRYLINHVRSPFMYIAPDEWDITVLLPLGKFAKASVTEVYRDSLTKVKN